MMADRAAHLRTTSILLDLAAAFRALVDSYTLVASKVTIEPILDILAI